MFQNNLVFRNRIFVMNSKVKYNVIVYSLFLIPFFELQTYDIFCSIDFYSFIFEDIQILLAILRIILSVYFIALYFYRKIKKNKKMIYSITVYVLFINAVSACNGSLYFNYFMITVF